MREESSLEQELIIGLDQLAPKIHDAIAKREAGKQKWNDGRIEWENATLDLCTNLHAARMHFLDNTAFGVWFKDQGFELSDNDRAGAIRIGADPERAQQVLADTESRSLELIGRGFPPLLERVTIVRNNPEQPVNKPSPQPEPPKTQPTPPQAKPAPAPASVPTIQLDYDPRCPALFTNSAQAEAFRRTVTQPENSRLIHRTMQFDLAKEIIDRLGDGITSQRIADFIQERVADIDAEARRRLGNTAALTRAQGIVTGIMNLANSLEQQLKAMLDQRAGWEYPSPYPVEPAQLERLRTLGNLLKGVE